MTQKDSELLIYKRTFGSMGSTYTAYLPAELSGSAGSHSIDYILLKTPLNQSHSYGTDVGSSFGTLNISEDNYIVEMVMNFNEYDAQKLEGFSIKTSNGDKIEAGKSKQTVLSEVIRNSRVLKLAFSSTLVNGVTKVSGIAVEYVADYQPSTVLTTVSAIEKFWMPGETYYTYHELADTGKGVEVLNRYVVNQMNASILVDWIYYVHKALFLDRPTEFSIDSITATINNFVNQHPASFGVTVPQGKIAVAQSQSVELMQSGGKYWFRGQTTNNNLWSPTELPSYYNEFYDLTGELYKHSNPLKEHMEQKHGWTYYKKFGNN